MTHSDLTIVLGPPGTGKTTDLLSIMQQELEAGVSPERIGFLAFTKKAALEATERACKRFSFKPDALPYFRTIHSLTFRQLGLRSDRVMQKEHYSDLGEKLGFDLRGRSALDEDWYGMDTGDRVVFLEGLARVQNRSLPQVLEESGEVDIDLGQLDQFARALARYKANKGLLDYTDMLEEFVKQARLAVPTLDALIVDEAQDLSILQWRVIAAIGAKAKRVYVAGDDDQAIYRWAGADVETFMGLRGKVRVLGQSYRIPASVHRVADAILQRVQNRTAKTWKPREEKGSARWYGSEEEVDLSQGSWLLLARNGYMLRGLEDLCIAQGFPFVGNAKTALGSKSLPAVITYSRMCRGLPADRASVQKMLTWMSEKHCRECVRAGLRKHDPDVPVTMANLNNWGLLKDPPIWHVMLDKIPERERLFFIAARRRGESLTKPARIKVSTIHTVKGGEADNVLLLTDVSQRTCTEMDRRADDEHRVFYVAVTRARQGLHLIEPRTGNFYEV